MLLPKEVSSVSYVSPFNKYSLGYVLLWLCSRFVERISLYHIQLFYVIELAGKFIEFFRP